MLSVELKEPQLVARVEHLATDRIESAERVLEMAVRQYLDTLDAEVIHTETKSFWAMHAELTTQYLGQHVAIHKAKVVDHDVGVRHLEARIRQQFGTTPVLIAPVYLHAQHELRWRGGHLEPLGAT